MTLINSQGLCEHSNIDGRDSSGLTSLSIVNRSQDLLGVCGKPSVTTDELLMLQQTDSHLCPCKYPWQNLVSQKAKEIKTRDLLGRVDRYERR